ncbi:MAG TPA: hypothetical protein PKU97_11215 [Kofleriaceae bacterium]|nr:hypothetical protein [Kofleriaceae bacterium]
MNRISLFLCLGLLAACGDDGSEPIDPPIDPPPGSNVVRLVDDISSNTTFTADKTYVVPRLKSLFVKPGVTLTIQPGTVIQGEEGSIFVVTRGAKLLAEGTAAKPIVFTSAQAEGQKRRGTWGGVLILGSAPININKLSVPASDEAVFEAFPSSIPEGKFGGTNPADNSGVLKYVRIEFAGFNYVADREFNNLTLAGVGSGTVIDYVQLHGGSDDGIEFFGGTVNAKHLLVSQNGDDGFDSDNGYNGKIQFLIVQNITPDGAREASNGYETDNHGTAASYDAEPRTKPTIYNATFVGDKDYTAGTSFAGVFRRGTSGHYYNHVFMNFAKGIEFRDVATKAQLDAGNLFIKSSLFFQAPAPAPQAAGDIDEAAYLGVAANNNRVDVDPGIPGMTNKTSPSFKPMAAAAALTGGATPPNDGFFDTTATFVGAMGADDWTTGWTAFPQPAN